MSEPRVSTEAVPGLVGSQRDTTRVDEQFRSLLEGLRTSLPGVQVLFAFLLTAPLQSGFGDLTPGERAAFSIAFYAAGLASVLLISPSVHQRLRAPATGMRRHSEQHLMIATWVTIVGTAAMGVAIVGTVVLVSSLVFDGLLPIAASTTLAAILAITWFYLPLVTFRHVDG